MHELPLPPFCTYFPLCIDLIESITLGPVSDLEQSFYFQVLDYNAALTGNGAEVFVYADGDESSSERRGADASVAGNQLSGTFTLTLRGWETDVRIA